MCSPTFMMSEETYREMAQRNNAARDARLSAERDDTRHKPVLFDYGPVLVDIGRSMISVEKTDIPTIMERFGEPPVVTGHLYAAQAAMVKLIMERKFSEPVHEIKIDKISFETHPEPTQPRRFEAVRKLMDTLDGFRTKRVLEDA